MLRRSRSAEEESSGDSPVQALVSRMGDNALLYVLGAALAVMLIVYFSLFIVTPRPNDENTANFDGSRAAGTGTVGVAATVPGNPAAVTGTPATASAGSPKPRNGNSSSEPASGPKLDLTWLPPGAELIASLRPPELWGTPLLAGAFGDESWQSFAQSLAGSSRLAITDFDRVTIGVSGLPTGGGQSSLSAGSFGRLLRQADMIVCVQAVKPVDAGSFALEQSGFSPVTHGGCTYYRGPAAPGGEGLCVLFAEKTRIVLGRESSLVAAIDRNGAAARRPDLDFADASGSLVIVGVPRQMAGWFPAAGGTDSAWSRFQPTLAGQARGVSLSLNLKGAGSVDLGIDARDTTSLNSLRKALEQLVAERRQRTGAWPASVNSLVGELFDRLSGNLKVDAKGTVVHARGALPKFPDAILSEVVAWGSPVTEDQAGGAGEVVYEELPSGPPRTPVTMLGVPGGLQMQAFVRWGLASNDTPGLASTGQTRQAAAKSPLRLELVLDLKGGPAAGGMARSICPTIGVTTDRGDKIVWRDDAFDGATGREMVRLVHGTDERPADGVRVVLSSERPALLPETITGFEGTLTLRAARETKLVSIPNLGNFVGKFLSQPELKGSGLTFKVERAGNSLIVRAKGRDLRMAGPGAAIDGKGQVLPNVKVEFVDSDSELQFVLPTGENMPRDAGLQIAVCTSVKDHVIPFRFERLEVPPVPKKRSTSTPPRGINPARHPGAAQRAPGSAMPIEPADLMQAFIDDPSGAKKRFQLQRLELTGTVVEVKSKGNVREIFLQVPQEGKSVSCDGFRDPTLIDGKINTGDTVTIRGSFLGVGNSDFVSLTQCELVRQ